MSTYAFNSAKRGTRFGSFIAGLGTLVSIWPTITPATRPPARSDLEALRGDSRRIGSDMRRVIQRERARVETTRQG